MISQDQRSQAVGLLHSILAAERLDKRRRAHETTTTRQEERKIKIFKNRKEKKKKLKIPKKDFPFSSKFQLRINTILQSRPTSS